MHTSPLKKLALACAVFATFSAAQIAQASTSTYNVITKWYEPDTQPNDSIFKGTFTYDSVTHAVSGLHGILSESMTGSSVGYPGDSMTWLTLSNQLVSWHDTTLHGTFAATFKNASTSTFSTMFGGTVGARRRASMPAEFISVFPNQPKIPGMPTL